VNAVCFCNFTDYRFVVSGTTARRVGVDLKILLVPMAEERAPDGGYLPDYERLARGEVEPTDRANLAHLLAYEADYLERPAVAQAVRIGEAAAFLRHLRASRINLRALAREMR
jgi:hypothetical protein